MSMGPHINDLIYQFYGGTPSFNDAIYLALLQAYNDGVNAYTLILSFANIDTAAAGDVMTADGAGGASFQPNPGGGGYGAVADILANRPAAGAGNNKGFFYATDVQTGYISNGSVWTTTVWDEPMAVAMAIALG